jgi:SAM-dependent methyltransferase
MNIFGAYSRYYNLLYKDKNYAAEAEYVHNLIQKYCAGAKSVLNLGCGTGMHDVLLAEKGYEIIGVDMSAEMIAVANSNSSALNAVTFIKDDIRTVRLIYRRVPRCLTVGECVPERSGGSPAEPVKRSLYSVKVPRACPWVSITEI